ncbi:MAG: leucyl aminopeptidase [Dehalococcoidia bacterium]
MSAPEVSVSGGTITQVDADTLVCWVPEGSSRLSGQAAQIDRATNGAIARMIRDGLITGRSGETTVVHGGRLKAHRVVVVGAGKSEPFDANAERRASGNLARTLRGMDAGRVAWSTQSYASGSVDTELASAARVEGVLMGLYRFDRHHTKEADRPRGNVSSVVFVEASARAAAAAQRGLAQGVALAEATNFARDLANEPANLMTPTVMATRAQEMAAREGLECTVIERAEAERLGMGSYLSVANGSHQPPKFIVLRYRGANDAQPVALIGKGITFDTGGTSIKPAAGMERMKGDMSGAASVLGAMMAIARLKPPASVLGVAPCTENMPGGGATKPGDVVYAMDGQSIEVINTDAEGRLILADGVAYAKSQGATPLIDIATLTGAINVALGGVRFGVHTNNDALMADLERASERSGEKLWRMPMDREYFEQIKSDVADVKNTGGAPAGSITGAKLIEMFAGDTPWAHLDIAGVMDVSRDRGEWVKGMSGQPVRTLVHLVLNRAR